MSMLGTMIPTVTVDGLEEGLTRRPGPAPDVDYVESIKISASQAIINHLKEILTKMLEEQSNINRDDLINHYSQVIAGLGRVR